MNDMFSNWYMGRGKERDLGTKSETHCIAQNSTDSNCSQSGSRLHPRHYLKFTNHFHILSDKDSYLHVIYKYTF